MNEINPERHQDGKRRLIGGWTGWLFDKLQRGHGEPRRLAVLDRITLAPRQSLALIEAEGRRLLVATSPDGAPAFYALDGSLLGDAQPVRRSRRNGSSKAGRLAC